MVVLTTVGCTWALRVWIGFGAGVNSWAISTPRARAAAASFS